MPQEEIFTSVQRKAIAELPARQLQNTNLHIQAEILKKGATIKAYQQKIPIEKDTVMVFADEAPLFNWAHPCRYLLYDSASGEKYTEVRAEFPPYLVSTPATFHAFHAPVMHAHPLMRFFPPILRCPIRFPIGKRYAILFSGASNNRHTNDLEFLYRTLRDHYGFADANIYVYNYDGTHGYNAYGAAPSATWVDGSAWRMPVKGSGTKANLDAALDDLKTRLKKEDLLLIHTNNHGGWDGPGKAYLCTYSGASYYAADFGAKLATLPVYNTLMVMMEQCHSGGFNAEIIAHSTATKTTIASACKEANNSIGGADFDPFARDWISGITGHNPYGLPLSFDPDTDASGKVSAQEAFNYANAVHDPYDTPVYNQNSVAAGATYLGQRYMTVWWFCPFVAEMMKPHYGHLPIPEFYDKVHTQLEPKLQEIEAKLDKATLELRREFEPQVKRIVESVFGRAVGVGG